LTFELGYFEMELGNNINIPIKGDVSINFKDNGIFNFILY